MLTDRTFKVPSREVALLGMAQTLALPHMKRGYVDYRAGTFTGSSI